MSLVLRIAALAPAALVLLCAPTVVAAPAASAGAQAGAAASAATRAEFPIEDPSGVALDGFFAALRRTEKGDPGAMTRVLHLGDSSIGLDGLPHALRRRMQTRFGDGGAGFVFLGRKSVNYNNRAVHLTSQNWSVCYIAYGCDKTGHYGYGGHVFRAEPGARTQIKTRTGGQHGRTASRIELWYATDPRGGTLKLLVDGEVHLVDTKGDTLADKWHEVRVEPGPHRVDIRSTGNGRPRAYGVVLETDGPGVVWDTVSMIGAFTKRLLKFDETHVAAQVAHRRPDLLVFGFGGNDLRRVASATVDHETLVRETRDVLQRVRKGKPGLACLVVSVVDHARAGPFAIKPQHNVAMVKAQREAAFAEGCAFFDAVAMMGGPGGVRAWRKTSPPLSDPDLQHLSMVGRDKMAGFIFDALMVRYAAFKARKK